MQPETNAPADCPITALHEPKAQRVKITTLHEPKAPVDFPITMPIAAQRPAI